ncbi:hypothetical protein HAX54_013013 [Datura stramonium]|uniref:Uncharacterized protein n=1 Tax=Datura stramonium TaxID=4076 RepID=A0ABS8TMG1_DATST|nr:hypothetical protein [Datura stramonium]
MPFLGIATLLVARLTVIIHEEKIFDHPRRIDPPKFKGDHREDAAGVTYRCHKRLHNLGLRIRWFVKRMIITICIISYEMEDASGFIPEANNEANELRAGEDMRSLTVLGTRGL